MSVSIDEPQARIAVLATPFGFGPASKAYSIGQLLSREYSADVQYFGSDSAWDFFAAQDDLPSHRLNQITEGELDFIASCDAIVNVLAPELISSPGLAALTHYVDSLGFMWQEADLSPQSLLRHVRGYYAQDLFGSVTNLKKLGISGVTAVSGIVAEQGMSTIPPSKYDAPHGLVNLGGLSNPAGTASADAYLPMLERLLTELQGRPYHLTVAMNCSNLDLSLSSTWKVRHLSGTDFRAALANCDVVFSSPGMTTLIETSQAGRPYVPLPPQNWSQVVICRHMAERSSLEIWPFLVGRYTGIEAHFPEMRKAAEVREINRHLAADAGFAAAYGTLARYAAAVAEVPTVGAPFGGARQVAAAVAADIRTWSRLGSKL
ncbi:hypothetical protein [Nocardia gipuzkoensis]